MPLEQQSQEVTASSFDVAVMAGPQVPSFQRPGQAGNEVVDILAGLRMLG